MACARPVIGVRRAAVPDTIVDGKTGRLIGPGNNEELLNALVDLLSDPKRAAEMGRAARLDVTKRFTQEGRARAALAAYNEAERRRRKN